MTLALEPPRTYTAEDLAKAREEGIAEGFARAVAQMRVTLLRMDPNISPNASLERELAKTIAQAGFCTRAQHVLEGVVETVRDLVRMKPDEVHGLDGMGDATFKNVKSTLAAVDLHLGMNI